MSISNQKILIFISIVLQLNEMATEISLKNKLLLFKKLPVTKLILDCKIGIDNEIFRYVFY